MKGDLELKRLQQAFSREWNSAIATGCPTALGAAISAEKELSRYRETSPDQRVADALGMAYIVQRVVITALSPFPAAMLAVARAVQSLTNGWRQ